MQYSCFNFISFSAFDIKYLRDTISLSCQFVYGLYIYIHSTEITVGAVRATAQSGKFSGAAKFG